MILNVSKNPTDATVCRYLFLAKLLYMFWGVTAPIIRSIKNCTRSLRYRSYYLYWKLRVQFLILLMMGAVTPETCRIALQ